jgi:acetyltransferase-like isoleucine patch superfamily enzyme
MNKQLLGYVGKSPVFCGRYTYGVANVSIREWGEGASLSFGSFCSISTNITIFLGGNHRSDWISTFPFGHIFQNELGGFEVEGHPATKGDVIIGNDVWIGANSSILSGVTIGDGAIIASNSNVVRDVAPYTIVGGNPAKIIKERFSKNIVDLLLKIKWWDMDLNEIKKMHKILCSKPNVEVLSSMLLRNK